MFNSPKISYGFGTIKELKFISGNKALIVTDEVLVKLGIVDKIKKHLEKAKTPIECKVFDKVEPDPKDTTCIEGAELAQEFNPDWIIGLGGGSAMDCAKIIWILYEHPEIKMEEIGPFKKIHLRNKAKFITIPTTSGTGAEITFAAVITNTQTQQKMSLASFELVPDIAIIDPNLVTSMPPKLTASTGLDALSHAIEGYVSNLKNDFADGNCLKAIQLIMEWLPKSYEGSKNIEKQDKKPREKMHYASTIAGIGFGNAAAGIAHGIGHSFGAIFRIQHGFCVGILLPYVIEYCDKTSRKYFEEIVNFLQLQNGENPAEILANSVRKLMESIDVPLSFKDYGIIEEDFNNNFEALVEFSLTDLSTKTSPRQATEEDIRKLIECSYYGKPVDF